MMAATVLSSANPVFRFADADGDRVELHFSGPGTASVELEGDRRNRADIRSILVSGETEATTVKLVLHGEATNIAVHNMHLSTGRFLIDANGGLVSYGQTYRTQPPGPIPNPGGSDGGLVAIDGPGGSPIGTPIDPSVGGYGPFIATGITETVTLDATNPLHNYRDVDGVEVTLGLTGPGVSQVTLERYESTSIFGGVRVRYVLENVTITGGTDQTVFAIDTPEAIAAIAGISFDDLGEVHVTSPADELFRIDSLNGEVYEAGVLAGDAVAQPHPDVRQSYRVTKDDPLDLRDADGDPFQITVDQDEVIVTLTGGVPDGGDIASLHVPAGDPQVSINMAAAGDGTPIGAITGGLGHFTITASDLISIASVDGAAYSGQHARITAVYLLNSGNRELDLTNSGGDVLAVRLHSSLSQFTGNVTIQLVAGATNATAIASISSDLTSPAALHLALKSDDPDTLIQVGNISGSTDVLIYDADEHPGALGDGATVVLEGRENRVTLADISGNPINVSLSGPGSASIFLDGDVGVLADIERIVLTGTTSKSRLTVTAKQGTTLREITSDGSLGSITLKGVSLTEGGIDLAGSLDMLKGGDLENGADIITGAASARGARITLDGASGSASNRSTLDIAGTLKMLSIKDESISHVDLLAERIDAVSLRWDAYNSAFTSAGDIGNVTIGGLLKDSMIHAGRAASGAFTAADIRSVRIKGNMEDSIIAAGVDPGEDGLFGLLEELIIEGDELLGLTDGVFGIDDVLLGGVIGRLDIGGVISGTTLLGSQPGVYATEIGRLRVNRRSVDSMLELVQAQSITGTAVIRTLASVQANTVTSGIPVHGPASSGGSISTTGGSLPDSGGIVSGF